MEHYSELIKLRKKYGTFDPGENAQDEATKRYPSTAITYIFDDGLSEKDRAWLWYENIVIFNRKGQFVQHAVSLSLKSYLFLLNNKLVTEQLITELYNIDIFDPLFCFVPINDLSKNLKETMTKAFSTLLSIENSMSTFACGGFGNQTFTYCQYPKIDKNIARVFIEYGVSILFAYYKNRVCLYFDPMSFSEEDLDKISKRINAKLKTNSIVNTSYDNYSITFVKECNCVEVFNIINEEPELHIDINGNNNNNLGIKPKINKPVFENINATETNIPKSKFSNKMKK